MTSATLSRAAVISLIFALGLTPAKAEDKNLVLATPFTLIDADGKAVRSTDFPAKFLLIYFGYERCSDLCPTALSALGEALDELGPAADRLQPLFITVDPEHDRGPDLRKFTAAFDERIIGLTGTQEQIAGVAKSLGIQYEKVLIADDDYVIDHSATLSLIDPDGHAAETFTMAEPYQIAAKLFDKLARAGVPLGQVNNLGAYR